MACASHSRSQQLDEPSSSLNQHESEAGGPLTLKELVRALAKVVRNKKTAHLHTATEAQSLLSRYDASLGEWKRFALKDDSKNYTRNLISTDRETYTLMLLCWTAGKESPIHDHPCDGCWMRCIEGGITETRYAMPGDSSNALTETCSTTLHSPAVAYIDDNLGLHKVGATGDGPAITLHLYAPPFSQCRVWLHPDEPQRIMRPVVTFYSEHGHIVKYDAPAAPTGNTRSCSGESAPPAISDLAPCAEASPAEEQSHVQAAGDGSS